MKWRNTIFDGWPVRYYQRDIFSLVLALFIFGLCNQSNSFFFFFGIFVFFINCAVFFKVKNDFKPALTVILNLPTLFSLPNCKVLNFLPHFYCPTIDQMAAVNNSHATIWVQSSLEISSAKETSSLPLNSISIKFAGV